MSTHEHVVEGRRVTFPVRIRDAAASAAVYPVRADRVRPLVTGTGLDVAAAAGRTLAVLAFVRYRVNDLGVYDEVGLAVPVRRRGRLGAHVLHLPVTATFMMAAGRALWGLPKWLATAELSVEPSLTTCRLDAASGRVLDAALRTSSPRLPFTLPARVTTLAPRGDVVLRSVARGTAQGVRLGHSASLRIGDGHPMAADLRALDLPRRPLVTVGIEHLAFEMAPAVALPR